VGGGGEKADNAEEEQTGYRKEKHLQISSLA